MTKVKMVEWVEPHYYHDVQNPGKYPDNYVNRTLRVTAEDAVTLQKAKIALDNVVRKRSFVYDSDELALNDFVVERWGKIIEVEE